MAQTDSQTDRVTKSGGDRQKEIRKRQGSGADVGHKWQRKEKNLREVVEWLTLHDPGAVVVMVVAVGKPKCPWCSDVDGDG